MPELPDVTLYIEALKARILGCRLQYVRISSPFLLRTASPPLEAISGKTLLGLRRIGKRIAFGFESDLWLVLHLMIAGRLHWTETTMSGAGAIEPKVGNNAASANRSKRPGKNVLGGFYFDTGVLTLTESASRKRASLHLVRGEPVLNSFDPGGLEVLQSSLDQFTERLASENHTLKRALTDPSLFSGIGNAYSDEILHRAQLSPVTLTRKLSPKEIERLHKAVIETLSLWLERLRKELAGGFPEHVTAFRPEMAVHGKFGKPCPVCGTAIQRIRYADNETNYCPRCQTGGKLLADRSLSLLLKGDWPKTLEELEEMRGRTSRPAVSH
jgi:formamidopyrimidine-DNA glycosylase